MLWSPKFPLMYLKSESLLLLFSFAAHPTPNIPYTAIKPKYPLLKNSLPIFIFSSQMAKFLAPILGLKVFWPTLLFLCTSGKVHTLPWASAALHLDLSHILAVVHHMLRSITSHHSDQLL